MSLDSSQLLSRDASALAGLSAEQRQRLTDVLDHGSHGNDCNGHAQTQRAQTHFLMCSFSKPRTLQKPNVIEIIGTSLYVSAKRPCLANSRSCSDWCFV